MVDEDAGCRFWVGGLQLLEYLLHGRHQLVSLHEVRAHDRGRAVAAVLAVHKHVTARSEGLLDEGSTLHEQLDRLLTAHHTVIQPHVHAKRPARCWLGLAAAGQVSALELCSAAKYVGDAGALLPAGVQRRLLGADGDLARQHVRHAHVLRAVHTAPRLAAAAGGGVDHCGCCCEGTMDRVR
jgi:hypothetical protein